MPSAGVEPTGHDVEQRRLAGAVRARPPRGAHGCRAAGRRRGTARARPAKPVADIVQLDHLVAEPGRAEVQVEDAGPGRGLGPALDDGRRRLDAGLGLAGPGRCAPPQPRQLLAAPGCAGPTRRRRPARRVGPALEVAA